MSTDRATNAPSELVLLGHPVSHSLSPRFQQAALSAAGLDLSYAACDVSPEDLSQLLRDLARRNAAGNVTIPHKEAVFALCAKRSQLAERVGAVNTFWHDSAGALVGHNTDVAGVTAAIGKVLGAHIFPRRVALLGAGGSAASVMVALETWPDAEVRICARTRSRAESLAARVDLAASAASAAPSSASKSSRFGARIAVVDNRADAVLDADLVINATPIGLATDEHPVGPHLLAPHAAVLDLVYRRGETPWVLACRERGHRGEDGLRMLVEQGAAAFECWFGMAPDRDAMWDALEARPYGR